MPIQSYQGPPPDEPGDSVPEARSRPADQYKQAIGLVRRYLAGRRSLSRDIVQNDPGVQSLGESEWHLALPRERINGRLIYREPSKLGDTADSSFDPFSVVYYRQLLTLIENNLLREDVPYFQAFVENQRPKELALELGINPKTASRRMNEVREKVQEILKQLSQRVSLP
jgi:hypothetical protein